MCIIYMTFYTAFITKEHFQIFGEMVQKVLKMRKCNLFLSNMFACWLTVKVNVTK